MNFKEAQERAQQSANRMRRDMCVMWDESGYSVLSATDATYTDAQIVQTFSPEYTLPNDWKQWLRPGW